MKYYKIFLLDKGKQKTVTEKALQEMEKIHLFNGKYKLIGECDANGNLLENIADNNFMNFKIAEKIKKKGSLDKSKNKVHDDELIKSVDYKPTQEQIDRRARNNLLHNESLKNITHGRNETPGEP